MSDFAKFVEKFDQALMSPAERRRVAERPEWQHLCKADANAKIYANVSNASIAIGHTVPGLGFDTLQQCMVWIPEGRAVRDADVVTIQKGLQRIDFADMERIGKDVVFDAMMDVARQNSFHPIHDYLNGLQWDGIPRVGNWLTTYLGVEQTPYTQGIGEMFLISMPARVFNPGCKADYCLVLEGPQGIRKSTACRALGDPWFSDDLPDVTTKDASQHLRGKWLIEVSEMSAMSKADSEDLKKFLTRAVEQYRPPFGRLEVREPRQCIFVGTTNKAQYLRDETGARRFWPVRCGVIDIPRLQADRDQLFAEAVVLLKAGRSHFPTPEFEREHIETEQAARYETDAWQDVIATWLLHKPDAAVGEIAGGALDIEKGKLSRAEQNRIMAVLERLGWQRGKVTNTRRPWVRGPEAVPIQPLPAPPRRPGFGVVGSGPNGAAVPPRRRTASPATPTSRPRKSSRHRTSCVSRGTSRRPSRCRTWAR